ncbi:hypothetical protein MNBD_PLANCTO02-2613 [hydrothermal vent metagenome]|uniref:Branched-chain amino acid aminotransferase n=1 Tax=hydrothermal vent metagenome TaxID=652676 RepID=A0A3B1E8B0_9ZZZZ
MTKLMTSLYNDENGFIISAELVLIATIAVLSMIVGLSEVSLGINNELEDVASSFGRINQSFYYNGLSGHGAWISSSFFGDHTDFCDGENDIQGTRPRSERSY